MCAKLSRVRCITFRVLARLRSERTTKKPDETDSMAAWGADARYTRLVSEHADRLLHLAVLMTGNRHDAEDIVQDVLISVASTWPVAYPLVYLKKAVATRCIDLIRKRREVPTDDVPDTPYDDQRFFEHEELNEFFVLLQDLPPRQRETLVLRYQFDLTDSTIAKMLGISVATVRSQAKHALRKLRQTTPLQSTPIAAGKDRP